jgi:hypothetical protein
VHQPDEPVALNAPVIRLLMLGAGIARDVDLAIMIGVNPSNFSRCMREPKPGERRQEPSLKLVDGLKRRFPVCPYELMVVPANQVDDPGRYGMTQRFVEEGPDPDDLDRGGSGGARAAVRP